MWWGVHVSLKLVVIFTEWKYINISHIKIIYHTALNTVSNVMYSTNINHLSVSAT